MIWKNRKWIGYGIYAVLFTGVMLYCRFPGEAFGNYLKVKAREANPDVILSFKAVSPSFPLGLRLSDVHVYQRETEAPPVFSARRFDVSPKLGSFLSKTPAFRFESHSYGGGMRGLFQFDRMDMSGPFHVSVNLENLQIEQYPRIYGFIHRQISGLLNGRVTYHYTDGGWYEGNGTADLNVSAGEIELPQPIFGLRALKLEQTSLSAVLKAKQIRIQQLVFAGPVVKGGLTGDVLLRNTFFSSRLNLKGTLEPRKDGLNLKGGSGLLQMFESHLSGLKRGFVIQGTFSSPVFKFI